MVPLNSTSISIIGCGWLGFPLALFLKEEGHQVIGATRNKDKLDLLHSKHIDAYKIDVNVNGISGDIHKFLRTENLYINIPPGRNRTDVAAEYPKEISLLVKAAKKDHVKRIIFISSTGVYADNNNVVDETTQHFSETPSGKALRSAETHIMKSGIEWVILRLAGLVGPERHPGKWFAGRVNLAGGQSPVNLVHLSDCISLSAKIIVSEISNEIFNICADEHPLKKDFYTRQSLNLALDPPEYSDSPENFKIISNKKIKDRLNYQFLFPDPMLF